jgi:dynein heavy chain
VLQAALALHERVSSTFRKTAINFHYEVRACAGCCDGAASSGAGLTRVLLLPAQFTVRHLANVFQGLLMSTPDVVNT